MLLVEVRERTIRCELGNLKLNDKCLKTELDLLQELRDKAKVREEACKQRPLRRYNLKIKPRLFCKGDLVWRMRERLTRDLWMNNFVQTGNELLKSMRTCKMEHTAYNS